MSLKAKIEAVIYAAEDPVTLEQIATLLGDELQAELRAEAATEQAQLPIDEATSADAASAAPEVSDSPAPGLAVETGLAPSAGKDGADKKAVHKALKQKLLG